MHFNFLESQKGYVITSANVENEEFASFYGLMLTLHHGNAMSCYDSSFLQPQDIKCKKNQFSIIKPN